MYLKKDYQFLNSLKTKYRKIRGNCNLLIKVKVHELIEFIELISKNETINLMRNADLA